MWKHAPDVRMFVQTAVDLASVKSGGRTSGSWSAIEFGGFIMHDHDARALAVPAGCTRFVGVDWREGPGVDLVCLNSEAPDRLGDERFDLSLSISALEHDPEWQKTLAAMLSVLSPGGIAAVTVPTGGWPPHEVECAPLGGEFYENRTVDEVLGAFSDSGLLGSILRATEDASVYGRRRANIVVTRA